MRALANLVSGLRFDWEAHGLLIGHVIKALMSCALNGCAKVQWNACLAVRNLLQNKTIFLQMTSQLLFPDLLLAFGRLLSQSANFKVRVQASLALMSLGDRAIYGNAYKFIVQEHMLLIAEQVEVTKGEQDMSSLRKKILGTLQPQYLNWPDPKTLLQWQCQVTLFHLFSLGTASDAMSLKQDLEKYHDFLLIVVRRAAEHYGCHDIATGADPRNHLCSFFGNTCPWLQQSLHVNLQNVSFPSISVKDGNGRTFDAVILSGIKGLARLYWAIHACGAYDLSSTLAFMDDMICHICNIRRT